MLQTTVGMGLVEDVIEPLLERATHLCVATREVSELAEALRLDIVALREGPHFIDPKLSSAGILAQVDSDGEEEDFSGLSPSDEPPLADALRRLIAEHRHPIQGPLGLKSRQSARSDVERAISTAC